MTYNGNGATGGSVPVDSHVYSTDDTVTVLGNSGGLSMSGKAFGGWNTKDDGTGTAYSKDFGTFNSLSLDGIPFDVLNGVSTVDMCQAEADGPLFFVIAGSVGSNHSVYAYKGSGGAWTDVSESPRPVLASYLVSGISPSGAPAYWNHDSSLITESLVMSYSGNAWAALGTRPVPPNPSGKHEALGKYQNLHF